MSSLRRLPAPALLLVPLLCCWLFLPFAAAAAQEEISAAGRDDGGEPIRSIQADFSQEKHLKILARPLLSKGRFIFRAPASLRWEYSEPVASIMVLDNGNLEKVVERRGRLVRDNSMSAGAMRFILPEIGNWLEGRFEGGDIFTVREEQDGLIVLTPREEGLQAVIRRIELRPGKRRGTMDSVTIVEGPDSSTVMRFSDTVINGEIPPDSFRLP